MVPQNISAVYAAAVQDARNNGGNFECACLFLIAGPAKELPRADREQCS